MFVIVDGPPPKDPIFSVFLETVVGGKSDDKLLSELPTDAYYIQKLARDYFSSKKRNLEANVFSKIAFACVEVRDLGFCDLPPFYAEVWARIRGLGHSLCEPSDALVLRQKLDQPIGDRVVLAMDGITHSGGIYHVYHLAQYHDTAPCIGVEMVRSSYKIHLGTKVIFRLKRF